MFFISVIIKILMEIWLEKCGGDSYVERIVRGGGGGNDVV